jgi:hypothetical protein
LLIGFFRFFLQPRYNRLFLLPFFLKTLAPVSSVGKTKEAPSGNRDWLRHFDAGNICRASLELMAVSSPQITVLHVTRNLFVLVTSPDA